MNRDETTILKGVAILMMVFHHLFNRLENVALCADLPLFNDQSLLLWLSGACNPVAFFVLLGGYGMYIVNRKGDRHRYTRILKLYVHLWLILAIFLTLGSWLRPDVYPGSFRTMLLNLAGYDVQYNNEYWFLLPYIVLMLVCPWLFRWTERLKAIWVVIGSFAITLVSSYVISHFKYTFLIDHGWLLLLMRCLNFLFAFMLGAMAARCQWFEGLRRWCRYPRWIVWIVLVILFLIRCCITTSFINTPYAFLFIALFLLTLPHHAWITRVLTAAGKLSMDIWLIHTWLCYYLFHDQIYALHNPLLIFVVVFCASYALAWVVNMTCDKLLTIKR